MAGTGIRLAASAALPGMVAVAASPWGPTDDAGADRAVLVGATVTLDGSGRLDADDDSPWNMMPRPAGRDSKR